MRMRRPMDRLGGQEIAKATYFVAEVLAASRSMPDQQPAYGSVPAIGFIT
jgi:hypothetical protein